MFIKEITVYVTVIYYKINIETNTNIIIKNLAKMNTQKYNEWLNETNHENKKNKDYVKYFYNKVYNICTNNGLNIIDEKKLIKKIGIFIYNNTNKNNAIY